MIVIIRRGTFSKILCICISIARG